MTMPTTNNLHRFLGNPPTVPLFLSNSLAIQNQAALVTSSQASLLQVAHYALPALMLWCFEHKHPNGPETGVSVFTLFLRSTHVVQTWNHCNLHCFLFIHSGVFNWNLSSLLLWSTKISVLPQRQMHFILSRPPKTVRNFQRCKNRKRSSRCSKTTIFCRSQWKRGQRAGFFSSHLFL